MAKETKVFVKNFLESQIPIMDPTNKKLLDKRLEIVDQEISQDPSKKPRFEDLLEKAGGSAEAVKLYQPPKNDQEPAEQVGFGIENFDPKNRLVSLRNIGNLGRKVVSADEADK